MKQVFRTDRGDLKKPERTPQGFLKVEGHVGRAGIYEYVNTAEDENDGFGKAGSIRRELRPDEAVFSKEALATFDGVSITVGHPRDGRGEQIPVTSDNVKRFEVGTVMGGARRDGDRVAATLLIKDKAAIKSVESGRQETSPGYAADVELKSGVHPKYGRYDCIQHNITYNHIGVVDHARGGSMLRLRMDDGAELVGHVEDGRFFRVDEQAKLTNAVDGHQHLVSFCDWQGMATSSGDTSWAVSDGADNQHAHPWTRDATGKLVIGESAGHTHTLLDEQRYSMQRADGEIDRSRSKPEGGHMADAQAENTNDVASKLRLQQVRADEAESLATQRKLRVDELEVQLGTMTGQLMTANETITKLNAQLSAGASAMETESIRLERTRADEAELALKTLQDSRTAEVNDRAEVVVRVRAVMGPQFRTDALTNDALCAAGIREMRPKEDLAGKNSAYLRSRFDSLCEERMRTDASQARVGAALLPNNAPPVPPTQGAPKHAWRDQWKTGLPED